MNQNCPSCGFLTTMIDNRSGTTVVERICPNCDYWFEPKPLPEPTPIFPELRNRMSMNNYGRNSERYMDIKTLAWIKELCNIIEEKLKEMK